MRTDDIISLLTTRATYIGMLIAFMMTLIAKMADTIGIWALLCHKRIIYSLFCATLIFLLILMFNLNWWWIIIACIPFYYEFLPLPHEIALLAKMQKEKNYQSQWEKFFITFNGKLRLYFYKAGQGKTQSERQDNQFELYSRLDKAELFPYEIKKYFIPSLGVLIYLGDFQRIKKELQELDQYQDDASYINYQIVIAYNECKYEDMLRWLKKSENLKQRNEKRILQDEINFICAYTNENDELNAAKYQKIVERKVFDGRIHFVEAYSDLMNHYEKTDNPKGIERIISTIREMKFKSFADYTQYFDIIYFHYLREKNVAENRRMLDELEEKAKELITDEEERVCSAIRMLRLYFECNYKWKEYSFLLFQNSQIYLNYSRKVAIEFMEATCLVLKNAFGVMGLSIPESESERLYSEIYKGMKPYVEELKRDFANYDASYVYRKKDILMHLLTYHRLTPLSEISLVDRMDYLVNIYEQVIKLCLQANENREILHFRICLADDILTMKDNLKTAPADIDISQLQKKLPLYIEIAKENIKNVEIVVHRDNYSQSLAYYILYLSQLHHQLSEVNEARYYYYKFCNTRVDPSNFTLAIQKIYINLKQQYG